MKRRVNPSLLIQTGRQWPRYLDRPLLNFAGYGKPLRARLDGVEVHVSPDVVVRMRAFNLLDTQTEDWRRND
jgi:hypothetical protein